MAPKNRSPGDGLCPLHCAVLEYYTEDGRSQIDNGQVSAGFADFTAAAGLAVLPQQAGTAVCLSLEASCQLPATRARPIPLPACPTS
jgi:hypothetical protein